jgi:hypothetical protein
MTWKYMPPRGTTGGILVGFKNPTFEIVSWQYFELCVTIIVKTQVDNFTWWLIVVYGSPYE